jgi:hypothetical protein
MYVIVIEHSHNKPALRQTFEFSGCVVEFFERVHQSVDLRKYHAVDLDRDASSLVTMLSIMRWI